MLYNFQIIKALFAMLGCLFLRFLNLFIHVHIYIFADYNFSLYLFPLAKFFLLPKEYQDPLRYFRRDADSLSQGDGGAGRGLGSSGNSEKGSESVYILKAELKGFSGRPDGTYERKEK